MAAGRGEFFRSFLVGLERQPAQLAPGRQPAVRGRGKPVPGGRQADSDRGRTAGRRRKRRPNTEAPSPVSGSFQVFAVTPCHVFFRLPSEILIKILSYLDVSSLFCISHVNKLFHQLADDDVMWHKIYMSEFGSQMWKPRAADGGAMKEGPVEVEVGDRSVGHWKKMYFRTAAGQEMNKWRRELRDISPYTGLPRQTEWVLRNLNVSWELTVCDRLGQESTLEQSRAYFFESSVIVRWSGGNFPNYHHISSIQLHGVRKETLKSPTVRKPEWRSLILKLDMKTQSSRFIGKDRLIKLLSLSPGVIIGVWRGQSIVAFIMVSLHFHKLVEKSLLGSPVWSVHFSSASTDKRPVYLLRNCCIMTVTLLDEFQKPFWCVSSPICITMVKTSLSFDYSGEHFLMTYQNSDGQVKMKLVWLKEQKQFFLISLTVYVSIFKVNKHFSTNY
uniref:F-box only protein 15-like n=1 Tax=Seriola lalandi dorsalis TaxID=1841481 RepID=A0A3B4XTX9_SERLL